MWSNQARKYTIERKEETPGHLMSATGLHDATIYSRSCIPRKPVPSILMMLIALCATSSAFGRPDGVAEVENYSLLHDLSVETSRRPGNGGTASGGAVTTVSFESLGRRYILDLVRNDRLVAKMRTRLRLGDNNLTVYQGVLRSVSGSWARVSIDGDRVAGVIWDGTELLLIDSVDHFEGAGRAVAAKGRLAIVRAADIRLPIDDKVVSATIDKILPANKAIAEAAGPKLSLAPAAGPRFGAISLGIVIDDSLASGISDEVQAAIEWSNIADGIFTEQVGVHLDLDQIDDLAGMPDVFTSTDPLTLLDELGDFKTSNPDLAPLGLVHLLTRKDLDGATLGVAQLASACGPSSGIGLTEARGGVLDALIMTHEIGHNLGAPHDNEAGSACASTPDGYLMSPYYGGNSTFSDCSITQMTAFLNGVSCLVPVATSEIELERPILPATVYYKDRIDVAVNVHNTGLESVVDSELSIGGTGGFDVLVLSATDRNCWSDAWGPQQVCDLDNMYAGETVTTYAEISPQATGIQTLDISVAAANDTDPSNNIQSLQIDVQPAVEASVTGINLSNVSTWQGGSVSYEVTVTNSSDFDTSAVVGLRFDPINTLTSSANCSSPVSGSLECDVGVVEAGGSSTFEIEVAVNQNLGLELAEELYEYIYLDLTTSLHNTLASPGGGLLYVVYGSVFDLEAGFNAPPQSKNEGEVGQFTASLSNLGPDSAPDVRFEISHTPGVELEFVSATRGDCQPDNEVIVCELGQFESGENDEFTISYTGTGSGARKITLRGIPTGGLLSYQANPTAYADFEILSTAPPSPPPGSKKGGGGVSIIWLLLMAATGRRRRRET
jgi:Metallo-peptidase family M12B Reprolysin-like/Domain of unknown function DUF11